MVAMKRFPRWLVVGLALEALAFGAIGLLILDMNLHRRAAERDGVNRWGYRGPIVGRRRALEHRLVVVGGSAAFGYGNPFEETFPVYLERNLQQRWRAGFRAQPVKVVNLAAVPDDAASFLQTLRDFEYLDYDIVCFYDGYNSVNESLDASGWRRRSAVFRRTGYLPILPFVVAGDSPVGRPRPPATVPAQWDRYGAAMDAAVGFVRQVWCIAWLRSFSSVRSRRRSRTISEVIVGFGTLISARASTCAIAICRTTAFT